MAGMDLTNIEDIIEKVGQKHFDSRPASLPYIYSFLAFTSEVQNMDGTCSVDRVIIPAANVIERIPALIIVKISSETYSIA